MLDIMLDLETLGVDPGCAIMSIGAIAFDLDEGALGEKFYVEIKPRTCEDMGLTINNDTLQWWTHQSPEFIDRCLNTGKPVMNALCAFSNFIYAVSHNHDKVRIWGNGADFDNVILTAAYKASGLVLPWNFRNNRCYRTAKAILPEFTVMRVGEHHNALDDAVTQALHLIKIVSSTRL